MSICICKSHTLLSFKLTMNPSACHSVLCKNSLICKLHKRLMYFVTVKTLLLHFQKRELEELQLQQRRQGSINEIIEEERLRLLKEHAAKLLGYLPKVSEKLL